MRRLASMILPLSVGMTALLLVPPSSGAAPESPSPRVDRSRLAALALSEYDVRWRRVTSGFSAPTQVTAAPDGDPRLFVVQKAGTVRVVRDGRTLRRPYLSIGGRIDPEGEGGLLSIAFSPTFRRDGLLWVAYSRASDGDLVVGRLKARGPRVDRVRSRTLRIVLRVEHSRYDNHYGGQLAFDADGRLYLGTGDGGSGGDPANNAGDKDSLLGKILRIDPFDSCRDRRYCVPSGNPFVGKRGRDEIWLMGLRNPWRFSVDSRTGDLWIGDVGQDAFEEVDRVGPNPRRIHLGWSCKEGRSTYNVSRCRDGVRYLGPQTVVRHDIAESITGGFVYRGQRYRDEIGGAYVFSDFLTRRVWLFRPGPGKVLQDDRLGGSLGATSFGEDDRGEIYAVTYDGTLWRMRVTRA